MSEILGKNQFYKPLEGFVENPLKAYPVNALCFCDSGKKFKKCHRLRLSMYCSQKDAKILQKIIDVYEATGEAHFKFEDPKPEAKP